MFVATVALPLSQRKANASQFVGYVLDEPVEPWAFTDQPPAFASTRW
jgi:hypothetical protein